MGPVETEQDAEDLLRDLEDVCVRADLALADGCRGDLGQTVEEVALVGDHLVMEGAGQVVELGERGDEQAAAGPGVPVHPVLDQGSQPREAAGLGERGPDDLVDELLAVALHAGQLERLLGLEMRVDPGLGHVGGRRERADRQTRQPVVARHADRDVQDRVPREVAFAHALNLARSCSKFQPS
jgi:hypothetical protein